MSAAAADKFLRKGSEVRLSAKEMASTAISSKVKFIGNGRKSFSAYRYVFVLTLAMEVLDAVLEAKGK